NIWFTSLGGAPGSDGPGGVVRFDVTANQATVFPSNDPSAFHEGVAVGWDGNLWFTSARQQANSIGYVGRISTSGALQEFALPRGNLPAAIPRGPDGNMWFIANDDQGKNSKIGRITPSGSIALFSTPDPNCGAMSIAAGPDGNIWFTEVTANRIGYLVP